MKAIRLHARGGTEQLMYEDAPKPRPGSGDALVHVYAAGITPTELSWSETYKKPDGTARIPSIPGHDLSGVVEEVAPGVTDVTVGEEVYALTDFWRDGTAAEYVAVRAADLAPKPRTLDHIHAAAVPLSALTAWQALLIHAGVGGGQRVLIHGGAGGVGTYAVQFAKWRGAYVIATVSARNSDFVRELGADEVIDYTAMRFENRVRDADVVLDTVGGDTLDRSWGVLRKGGVLVTLAGPIGKDKAAQYGVRSVFFIVEPSRTQLGEIARLIDSDRIRPLVSNVLPLARARDLFAQGLSGHTRGKLVLSVFAQEHRAVA